MALTYTACPSCRAINRIALDQAASKEPICGKCKAALPLHFGINEVTASSLQALIAKSPLPVVVDFWAPWCGPCKAFAPSFQEAARLQAGKFVFCKLDTEAHPLAGETYKIRSIPTLAVFAGGLERKRHSGAMATGPFIDWLENSLA